MHAALAALALLGGCRPPPSPLSGAPLELPAERVGGADIRWYDVGGGDVRSLRESVRGAAPRNDAGEPTLGRTQWSATWRWEGAGEPCAVRSVAVDLSVLVWLPRWTPAPGTDPALVRAWLQYLEALALHERGHVELVRGQAAALDDILRASACADVDTVGAVAVEAIRALNDEYDAQTGHGRTQGARYWTAPEWGAELEEVAPWAP